MPHSTLSCHPRYGARRGGGWNRLLALPLFMIGTLAWADLAGLDKPADSEAMQARVNAVSRQIRVRPDAPELYVQRAEAYFKLREFDKAIEDYSTAIRLDEHQDDAYFGRGMALGRRFGILAE